MVSFDASQLEGLAAELGRIGARSVPVMTSVFQQGADDLVTAWAANARQTSGVHGKHYPDSIDAERRVSTNITFEVGPNPAKPQGSMAFETGSAKQPPHPDGQRAADVELPKIDRAITAALSELGL
jgi:hypothetical protein